MDAGFETVAPTYSDIEAPKSVAFDMNLADMIADSTVRSWFTLNNGSISLNTADSGWNDPISTAIIVPSQDGRLVDDGIERNDSYRGTYFGAEGDFVCTADGYKIERKDAGDTPCMLASGTWTFTPADGATVMVPDQDWLAFGVWVTAPDDEVNGVHRVGVFHESMDNMPVADSLTGKASYEGSTAGVYVDRNRSDDMDKTGLFTARAMLEADFGNNSTPGTLTGMIDNFKDDQGRFLGEDTAADPNDPVKGGDSDWSVVLNAGTITANTGLPPATSVAQRMVCRGMPAVGAPSSTGQETG